MIRNEPRCDSLLRLCASTCHNCNKTNYYVSSNGTPAGGHAVIICGYDQEGVYIQNSWGRTWGFKGFCLMKWEDVLKTLIYVAYIDGIYNVKL